MQPDAQRVAVAVAFTIAALTTGAACSAGPKTPPAAVATTQPWIAYQTLSDGGQTETVRLMHEDGSDDHRIGQGVNAEQVLPDWSPDGKRLAFATRGGEHEPAYVYGVASGGIHPLFACQHACLGDDEPAFAPDGDTVAVARALGPIVGGVPSDCGIWVGSAGTGQVHALTHNPACAREYHPRWSPDGASLVYWRWHEDSNGDTTGAAVFVIDRDGTHERRLTDWGDFYGDPDWSRDGKWIAFSSHPLQAFNFVPVVSDLFRIHPDGSRMQRLTGYQRPNLRATKPGYTPDGRSILFTAVTPTSRELWVMPAAGGRATPITTGGIRILGTLQPHA
jgi:Tol biopolymer transport system component